MKIKDIKGYELRNMCMVIGGSTILSVLAIANLFYAEELFRVFDDIANQEAMRVSLR